MSTVEQSVASPSFLSSAYETVEAPVVAARDFVTPGVQFMANKVQQLWEFLKPYLETAVEFMTSSLGISLTVLASSIIPLQLSRTIENRALSIMMLAIGIGIAATGGYLLSSSGALPSLVTNITPAALV